MLSVNFNPSNLTVQRNLFDSCNALTKALERMSTGYKVNSAKDDAAGLFVASSLNTQIRGLRQAQKNVADGISILNTAGGSLSHMTDLLNRLRDLTVQGANGIYDDTARDAMQAEADALTTQLYQIKKSTVFNGKNIFEDMTSSPPPPKLKILAASGF